MSPIQVLLALHILSMTICILTCLPITSKPIENTPEHLAWEAWIMVPPTHDKTRKITPKSIFILPNKTNGGAGGASNTQQIHCPPGHRVDNYRCIPTVNIDRDQILIAQLTNLLHSTDKYNPDDGHNNESSYSYDYDYDYGDGDGYDSEGSEALAQAGHAPPDYNGEPLKINLSLGKFPSTRDDSKNVGNFGIVEDVGENDDDLKVQPFRAQETSSTTTNSATSSKTTSTTQFLYTTPTVTTIPSKERSETTVSDLDLPNSSHISPISVTTAGTRDTTPSVLILSPAETEMSSIRTTSKNEPDSDFDYGFSDRTTTRTTTVDDDEMDIVTEIEESKTDLKEDLIEESLVFDKIQAENTTQPEDSTEVDLSTTTIISQEDPISQTEVVKEEPKSPVKHLEEYTLPPKQNETIEKSDNKTSPELKSSNYRVASAQPKLDQNTKKQESIKFPEEREPVLEGIESNNRFVYHHLGAHGRRPQEVEPTASNIQDQLRMINRIVEENKRRAQQHERFRFPTELEEQQHRGNFRDYVRFPDPVTSHAPSPALPHQSHEFRSEHFPIHKKFPEWMQQPTIITPASTPNIQRNTQKPFWWLPNGWEVDRNGDRPLLLRFWSRTPVEHDPNNRPRTSSSSSTSGYRENSRSPTENLYKEISAQEVYKVLGAKQWKHNR